MKILVTGATGFIGNYVVSELLNNNFDVITTGIESKKKIHREWLEKVTYVQADLNESSTGWFTLFEEPDMIIHLSWQGLPNYKELFHFEKNLPKNYYFLKNMVESGCEKVVVIGTCFEYGMQSGSLKENLETTPDNPYALAKDTLRKYLEQLQKHVEFNLKWVRLFYMYGEGQNPNSILSQLETALEKDENVFNMSGGEQLRDYLPVEKVAEYIVKISLQNKINGIINCCSGELISIRKLVENYLVENNKTIELNFGYYPYPDYEPMAFWGSVTKLNKAILINRKN
jgi:nucleoside-diphosphate-sugar epimerase